MELDQEAIAADLAEHGLILRGGVELASGEVTGALSLLLVGHAGAGHWAHFTNWREHHGGRGHPLDNWSRQVIGTIAEIHGARAVFPDDRPYLPFQQWAMRAEGLQASPLGILMHPQFGLWHAYRGALLFDRKLAHDPLDVMSVHPCDHCQAKPCLESCPVSAFSIGGYDVSACRKHVNGQGSACRQAGCQARNACPVGTAYRYPTDVQAFHMAAFV